MGSIIVVSTVRSIFLLLLLALSFIPMANAELENESNDSWTLINDGYGFENAVKQEYPRFDDFEEQEEYFKDYVYPDMYTYNNSLNIGRDAENQILWVSFRPTIQYGNRDTWPSDIGNRNYWPTIENDSVKFPDDPENIGYYLSEPLQIIISIALINVHFTGFVFYPDPEMCPNTDWQNQWDPCDINYQDDKSFPLVGNNNKSKFQLTEGIANRTTPGIPVMFNMTNIHSYDDVILDKTFFCNLWYSCQAESVCCTNLNNAPQMYHAQLSLLANGDYDNFGLKYEIESHPASVYFRIYDSLIEKSNERVKPKVPDVFFEEREGVKVFISPNEANRYNYPESTGEAYIGPSGKTIFEEIHESTWFDRGIEAFDLTEDKLIDPIIVNDPYVPEINVHPPQTSYRPSITLALITTTAASTVALSASVVFLNRKMAENINRNPVKLRDQKRRSKIIRSALSKNIIRRD